MISSLQKTLPPFPPTLPLSPSQTKKKNKGITDRPSNVYMYISIHPRYATNQPE